MTRSALLAFHAAALCAAAGLAAAPRAALAQSPVSFGVTGALAVPLGRLGDGVNSGYSVGGLVDFHPLPGPLSVRLEGAYDRFEVKRSVLDDLAGGVTDGSLSGNAHFTRGNANLVLRLPRTSGLRPYLIGGVGVYGIGGTTTYSNRGTTVSQSDQTQTKFGVNGGLGVELPLTGISVFLEARAHGVQTDATPVTYIPITVGIRF